MEPRIIDPPIDSIDVADWEEFVDNMIEEHVPRSQWKDELPEQFAEQLLEVYELLPGDVIYLDEPVERDDLTVVGLHQPTDQPVLEVDDEEMLLEDVDIDEDSELYEEIWNDVYDLR